jgi:hypothetical protein
VAIKEFRQMDATVLRDIAAEVQNAIPLDNPNLLRLFGATLKKPADDEDGDDEVSGLRACCLVFSAESQKCVPAVDAEANNGTVLKRRLVETHFLAAVVLKNTGLLYMAR